MSARGRKPRTAEDGELRQHTVAVRFSPAEYARVVRAAGDAPLGTWAHRVVLGATEPVPVAGRAIDEDEPQPLV